MDDFSFFLENSISLKLEESTVLRGRTRFSPYFPFGVNFKHFCHGHRAILVRISMVEEFEIRKDFVNICSLVTPKQDHSFA